MIEEGFDESPDDAVVSSFVRIMFWISFTRSPPSNADRLENWHTTGEKGVIEEEFDESPDDAVVSSFVRIISSDFTSFSSCFAKVSRNSQSARQTGEV